jgi:prolyl 4-hydroxylase
MNFNNYGLVLLSVTVALLSIYLFVYNSPGSQLKSAFRDLDLGCVHYNYSQQPAQPGQHLVCVIPEDSNTLMISVIQDSLRGTEIILRYKLFGDKDETLSSLYTFLNSVLKYHHTKWKSFTFDGDNINSFDEIVSKRSFAIYTNGNFFIWPGVSVGFKRNVSGFTMETISLRPLVLRIDNFLSNDECEYIRAESYANLENSGVQLIDSDKGKAASLFRTSTQTFLSSAGRPAIEAIDTRSAMITRTSVYQQEFVQVLRYKKGQFYDQHYDYFDPADYKRDPSTLEMIRNGEKNRLSTVFWYLSTVNDGGHTIFPLANGNIFNSYTHNYKNCNVQNSLKVPPRKGSAIIFYSLQADGSLDRTSLHGACPVEGDDEKWAANKWIWSEEVHYIRR